MKCTNCIHYDVCQYHIDEETTMTVNECPTGFKHKDQYIKLPAYIGQTIWRLSSKYQFVDNQFKLVGYNIKEGKVSMLQQKADKSWKIRVSINSNVSDFKPEDIGQDIFLSEAKANKVKVLREANL